MTDDEAKQHALARLTGLPLDVVSVAVARGIDDHGQRLDYIGCWDRNTHGDVSWEAASLT